MFGFITLPAIIQFLGFLLLLPESPRWLIRHGEYKRAKEVLLKVHDPTLVDSEYESILNAEIEQRRIEENYKGTCTGHCSCL